MRNINKDGHSLPILPSKSYAATFPEREQALFDLLNLDDRHRAFIKACAYYDCGGDVISYVRKTLTGAIATELECLSSDYEGGEE